MMSPILFCPVSYGIAGAPAGAHAVLVGSTSTANGDLLLAACPGLPGKILAAGFTIVTAITVGAPVITVKVNPIGDATTNARSVDTITLPVTSSTIGDVVCNGSLAGLANADVDPGETIAMVLTTIGGGAGDGIPWVLFQPSFGAIKNDSSTVAKNLTNAVGSVKNVLA